MADEARENGGLLGITWSVAPDYGAGTVPANCPALPRPLRTRVAVVLS